MCKGVLGRAWSIITDWRYWITYHLDILDLSLVDLYVSSIVCDVAMHESFMELTARFKDLGR